MKRRLPNNHFLRVDELIDVYCKLNMTEVANRNSPLVKGGNPQKCGGPLQA
jgi:hypothetical protein